MKGSNFKTCKSSKIFRCMTEQIYKSYENYSGTVYKCHQAEITQFLYLPQYLHFLTPLIFSVKNILKIDVVKINKLWILSVELLHSIMKSCLRYESIWQFSWMYSYSVTSAQKGCKCKLFTFQEKQKTFSFNTISYSHIKKQL